MSTTMLSGWDGKIKEAQTLLTKVEDKAVRLREAIATFKAERRAAQSESQKSESATQC